MVLAGIDTLPPGGQHQEPFYSRHNNQGHLPFDDLANIEGLVVLSSLYCQCLGGPQQQPFYSRHRLFFYYVHHVCKKLLLCSIALFLTVGFELQYIMLLHPPCPNEVWLLTFDSRYW